MEEVDKRSLKGLVFIIHPAGGVKFQQKERII